ncbi:MAG: recombinase family protein [Burkholderiaceae bacterium]|nr:recombinase family protein [Burkholderiaceae bacterium]
MSTLPCAIYTRKSSEEGLEQGFNSLDAQREACEAYIVSQKALGWKLVGSFDDGGFSGGNVERPGLKKLLAEITAKRVRVVVVYKVDRLTRSLADFAKLVELFDAHGVSFVSVTQAFNTTTSMGRLTLNVLLSFAQFEREVTGERIRDKIAASKKKGMWMGGFAPIGYLPHERSLAIDPIQAERVREIFRLYSDLGSVDRLHAELHQRGWRTPARVLPRPGGDRPFTRGHLYRILGNAVYIGQIVHKGAAYPGQHPAIVEPELWQAVQERLSLNLHGHRCKTNAKEPSLLAGLVFDDQGTRLAPSHATKGSRRYRYYVRQVSGDEVKALRVPAPELEEAVIGALEGLLMDEARLLGLMGRVDADRVRSRLQGAAGLAEGLRDAGGRIDRLQRLVVRVALGLNAIEVTVRVAAIWSDGVDEPCDSWSEPMLTTLTVPAQLKRCGQAVRLIVKAAVDPKTRTPDPRLLGLLAKAQGWFKLLSSGQVDSVLSIARQHRMASADVTRVVYLAFLAPDIVQTIVRGTQPLDLNIKRMLAAAPLPMDWAEQRRVLGFDG